VSEVREANTTKSPVASVKLQAVPAALGVVTTTLFRSGPVPRANSKSHAVTSGSPRFVTGRAVKVPPSDSRWEPRTAADRVPSVTTRVRVLVLGSTWVQVEVEALMAAVTTRSPELVQEVEEGPSRVSPPVAMVTVQATCMFMDAKVTLFRVPSRLASKRHPVLAEVGQMRYRPPPMSSTLSPVRLVMAVTTGSSLTVSTW
jgi:hypothetical protein